MYVQMCSTTLLRSMEYLIQNESALMHFTAFKRDQRHSVCCVSVNSMCQKEEIFRRLHMPRSSESNKKKTSPRCRVSGA